MFFVGVNIFVIFIDPVLTETAAVGGFTVFIKPRVRKNFSDLKSYLVIIRFPFIVKKSVFKIRIDAFFYGIS